MSPVKVAVFVVRLIRVDQIALVFFLLTPDVSLVAELVGPVGVLAAHKARCLLVG